MSLKVKRSFKIDKYHKLELDKKGIGIDFGDKNLFDILSGYIKISDDFNIDNYKKLNIEDYIKSAESLSEYIKEIVNLHKKCGEKINWNSITQIKQPFDCGEDGPNKLKAQEYYENYTPSLLEKIFKFLSEKRKNELFKRIKEAEKEDNESLENFKKLKEFACSIVDGNIDSYFQLIDSIMPFYNLVNYGSTIEFGTNDKDSIEIEFNANSKEVVPNVMYYEDENGIMIKGTTDTASYYDNVQDYVCSATIMIAKKVMNLLPVKKVVVHVVDNVKDYETGVNRDITILSVVFDRETLEKLNLKSMESTFALDNFICNMRHQKATGFKSVERITQY